MKYNKDVDKPNLDNNLLWQLLLVSFKAKKGLIKIADELDLSFVQVYTLCFMKPGQPLSMNKIAGMLNCDASNVTGIIDRLFSRNYITRQEDPDDRRVKMIQLTTEGKDLRAKIVERILTYKSDALDKLNEQEKKQLQQLLVKVLA